MQNERTSPAKPIDSQIDQSSLDENKSPLTTSRRGFLKTAGIGAAALTAGGVLPAILTSEAEAREIAPFNVKDPDSRVRQLIDFRTDAAKREGELLETSFPHPTNGDEERYRDQGFAGNFSKTLPHDPHTGLVNPNAYKALLNALEEGTQEAFDAVPAGGRGLLAGPLSPLQFQIAGSDSPDAKSPFTPPSVASAGGAAEMVEIYWEAYLRDVPFINYGSNPLVGLAVADMNKLSDFGGPKPVTPQNLFRFPFIGCADGPYVSQILYQTHRLDGIDIVPKLHTRLPVADPNTGQVLTGPGTGVDFMTNFPEYLFVEDGNGALQPTTNTADPTPRFIRNVRDVGNLANSDSIFSVYFRAAIILGGLGIGIDPNNPYHNDTRINGFNTFSNAYAFQLLAQAPQTEAAAFYEKWYVHRKVRPEAHANLVDGILTNRFQLHPSMHADLLNSSVLPLIFERNRQLNVKRGLGTTGSFMLPQISAGGSPSHPSSPAGHAFTAGCSVTILKAMLDVGTPTKPKPWPVQPVQASADGLSLVNTSDTNLTVLGELNKLAANVSEGRNMLGIHWRVSDNMHGMFMGEKVAIRLLNELGASYPEKFNGWTLTKFDGTTITVGASRSI
ncbi:MAG TPA: twin-arginine translocation signal domain-containing protein [Candidatus Angelobacter sp.]|jgi:hypothetical protein|nr:twin-arginine translocation signal domain-containing protein [Candidatus Angelobacter sp.]